MSYLAVECVRGTQHCLLVADNTSINYDVTVSSSCDAWMSRRSEAGRVVARASRIAQLVIVLVRQTC